MGCGFFDGNAVAMLFLEWVCMFGLRVTQVDVGVLGKPFGEVMVYKRPEIGQEEQSYRHHGKDRDTEPGR